MPVTASGAVGLSFWNRVRLLRKSAARRQRSRGNLTIMTGLLVLPSAIAIVMAIEIVALNNERAMMQSAADAAALAGACDLMVSGSSRRNAKNFAERFALSQVGSFAERAKVAFVATPEQEGVFAVDGFAARPSFFGSLVPPGGFRIQVRSVAENMVRQPLCILGQNEALAENAISGDGSAGLNARGCVVHANGDIILKDRARVTAGTVRTSGTSDGGTISPTPNVGALKIPDPFSARTINPPKACACVPDGGTDVWKQGILTLPPGMHRTQFVMRGTSIMKLLPGEHYFCSPSIFSDNSRLEGQDAVMMLIEGELTVRAPASTSLKGRETGTWAGFVIVASRTNASPVSFLSPNVDELLGTIYLPNSNLVVNSPGSIAEASQWSVIVAHRLIVSSAAQLIINSDYEGSPVPVPIGVGSNVGGANDVPLRLRQ
jgi:hypothetical protein